jgi:glycosyltransferase involved in cell wall biosynthesis
MVAGVPVIVTPETGMGEIVERHGAGAIVRPAPEPLGDCIAFLAQNPRMLDEYGRNALKAAEADLSFSAHGAALRRCYDRLLAE